MSQVREIPRVAEKEVRRAVVAAPVILRPRRSFISYKDAPWIVAIGDVVALATPLVLATSNLVSLEKNPGLTTILTVTAGILLWLIFAGGLDLYSVALASSFKRTHRATLCAVLLVFAAKYVYIDPAETSLVLKYSYAVSAVLGVALWRTLFAAYTRAFPISQRVLVVGAGSAGTLLAKALRDKWNKGEAAYYLVGFVDDDPEKIGSERAGAYVHGSSRDVEALVDKYQVDTVALAINQEPVFNADVFNAFLDVREKGVRVVGMVALYEYVARKVALSHVKHNWGITFTLEDMGNSFGYGPASRALDIVTGVFGCIIVGLISPFLMIANKFMSPGPLLYSQLRVGKGGKPFRIYKFRSMIVNAEASGAVWASEKDPRITKLGNFLRRTRLDELPQFWNVLKGEMSLIGPRPERPEFVEILACKIPFYRARHAIKPGLTGWAQVMYRYGASEEDALTKLEFDLYYVKHRSLALDLHILARSVVTVLTAAGR
ncbi:MAG TPA: sugar transferase [Fimbriimonas sp.]|nr:sugar transferase [Fimbriimonas sp.]